MEDIWRVERSSLGSASEAELWEHLHLSVGEAEHKATYVLLVQRATQPLCWVRPVRRRISRS